MEKKAHAHTANGNRTHERCIWNGMTLISWRGIATTTTSVNVPYETNWAGTSCVYTLLRHFFFHLCCANLLLVFKAKMCGKTNYLLLAASFIRNVLWRCTRMVRIKISLFGHIPYVCVCCEQCCSRETRRLFVSSLSLCVYYIIIRWGPTAVGNKYGHPKMKGEPLSCRHRHHQPTRIPNETICLWPFSGMRTEWVMMLRVRLPS